MKRFLALMMMLVVLVTFSFPAYAEDFVPGGGTTRGGGASRTPGTDDEYDPGYVLVNHNTDYIGMFPSIIGLSNRTDTWMVYKTPHSIYYLGEDTSGNYTYSDSGYYSYYLVFFASDFAIDVEQVEEDLYQDWYIHDENDDIVKVEESYTIYYPQINFSASNIYAYRLKAQSGASAYDYRFTDVQLNDLVSANKLYWTQVGVTDAAVSLLYPNTAPVNRMHRDLSVYQSFDAFQAFLDDRFIGCNFTMDYLKYQQYRFINGYNTLDTDTSGRDWDYDNYIYRVLPAFGFSPFTAIFEDTADEYVPPDDGAGDSSDSSDSESTDGSILGWLEKIYTAIVDGFNAVLDKIGIGSDGDDVVETPDEDNGFSLLDVISNTVGLLVDVVLKLFGAIFDVLAGIGDLITGFFNHLDSGFSTTDDDGQDFTNYTTFFEFVRVFWTCVPGPIVALVSFMFSFSIIMAVLKMFH